jgi:hypothetical protein
MCVIVTRYYSREDTEDACKYISGTILDDRPIRVDFDWGFQDGRQWGRGRSGGQVNNICLTMHEYFKQVVESIVYADILVILSCIVQIFCFQHLHH